MTSLPEPTTALLPHTHHQRSLTPKPIATWMKTTKRRTKTFRPHQTVVSDKLSDLIAYEAAMVEIIGC